MHAMPHTCILHKLPRQGLFLPVWRWPRKCLHQLSAEHAGLFKESTDSKASIQCCPSINHSACEAQSRHGPLPVRMLAQGIQYDLVHHCMEDATPQCASPEQHPYLDRPCILNFEASCLIPAPPMQDYMQQAISEEPCLADLALSPSAPPRSSAGAAGAGGCPATAPADAPAEASALDMAL